MDPNLIAALIGAASGLLGAIIGGVIAARATSIATRKANEHSLSLQESNQKAAIHGVLLGLRAEIETLWEIYSAEFGSALEELKEGEPFLYHYPLHQNYFTVYESNAALFGQIPDDKLRKTIITTYLRGRGLIDSHLYNNHLIEGHLRLQRLREETNNPVFDIQINVAMEELKAYARFLKEIYGELKPLVTDLTRQIDHTITLTGGTSKTVGLIESKKQ
jgi:hypothetical protein